MSNTVQIMGVVKPHQNEGFCTEGKVKMTGSGR